MLKPEKLGDLDSNQNKQNQNLLCYRYTIPQDDAYIIGGKIALYQRGKAAFGCVDFRCEFTLSDALLMVKPASPRNLS